ncbi:Ig-like domain-containing protein [Phytohabitans sp. ZYX-F-186]|uniref:Ig-like domain-containing protein n=1 Tax=Phytohabitans maris TaxID=3071409 RepID=A0ABU0ZCJ6_9ACTN|nr:Ig-like domain-containing protein [Phytohabitans sp. ZYX-F-186]MDQ7904703.1 Ig-like domain-containing protein [Phytohabitans sp. ZYX-F-186]
MRSHRRTPSRKAAWRAFSAAVLAGVLALTACGNDSPAASWNDGKNGGGGQQQEDSGPKQGATVTSPAADAKDVPASTAIAFTMDNASNPTVELKSAGGEAVEGTMQEDGKSWLPSGALEYGTAYTVTINATGSDGKPTTSTSSFTTMAKPSKVVRVSSFLGDGQVVGVGMPLIVRFGREVPQDYRDDVQRRLFVQSTPQQEGIWHWTSPTEVHYRPKTYWQAGTKISYKLQTGGLPMGDGYYGRADVNVDVKIGPSFVMSVDNKTKKMTVTKDGKVIKTIPVSLGKKSTPSASGTMVIIEKQRKTVFDTMDDPNPANRYRTPIDYAQRLTWSGQFIHAAPWSEGVQGRTNVSHGCVNVSMAMGAWLFGQTRIGDVITVKNTEEKLQNGNGWTDWNMSWEQYVKGSAIPYNG